MDYRGYELLEEKLREAILKGKIDKVESLLKKKAFKMLGEEMDELLRQLGNENLQNLLKRMKDEKATQLFSKEAQLKHSVELNDFAHIHETLKKQKCGCEYHLRASSIASIAMSAMRTSSPPNYAMIELLFQCACDVEPRLWDSEVALPVLYGVLSESPERVRKRLLQLPEATSRCVPVAFLHLAVKSGDISMVEKMISDPDPYIGVDDIYLGDGNRATALLRASHYGHDRVVAYLIGCGADITKRDRNGRTALHLASAQGHNNVVRLLLQQMLDPTQIAAASSIRRRIRQDREMQQPLTLASVVEDVARIDYVDALDRWGLSALHLAVCGGHVEVVEALLSAGADLSVSVDPHQFQSSFVYFLDTYLTVCRKEVIMNENLYTRTEEAKDDGDVGLLPRNDCFRLSPVMSVYWQPGGFTALHFAIAYARNGAVLDTLRPHLSEDVLRMKDSNGLTALDWAVGMLNQLDADDGHGIRQWIEDMIDNGGAMEDFIRHKVRGYKQVLESMEERKKEMEWADKMGWALRNGDFVVAEALAKQSRQRIKQPLSDATIEHLKWAASKPSLAIREQWRANQEARRFVMPEKRWAQKVEKVLVEVVRSRGAAEAPVMEATDLQQLVVWALRKGMADLATELSNNKDCELVEPLRGGTESLAPLDAAVALRKRIWEIEPVLHAMESRPDVLKTILQKRKLYVIFLNAILLASVLIGGLAFTAILQPPSSVRNTHESSLPPSEASGSQNHRLAEIFIWTTEISFFFAMIATLGGINGAIPPAKGELASSQRRMHSCIEMAVAFMMVAVIAIAFSFGAEILDKVNMIYKERWYLKVFAIAVAPVAAMVWARTVIGLMETLEPMREIMLQAMREFPNESCSRRWRRRTGLFVLFWIMLILEWLYPVKTVLKVVVPFSWRDKMKRMCLAAACRLCGRHSGSAVIYKSLRTLGVQFNHGEDYPDQDPDRRLS